MTKSGKARVLKIMAFGGWGFDRMETDGGGRIRVGDIRRYVGGESRRIALECVGIKGVDAYLNGGDRGPRLHSNETAAAVLGYNPYAPSVFGNAIICGRDKSGSPVGLSDAQELSLWRRLDRVLRGAARAR